MRIHRHRVRKPKYDIPKYKTNYEISAPELRVFDETNQDLGVLKTAEAIKIAETRELDLVEVSPKADPPVAKILDHGQFRYQKEKEIRKQRVQSREVEIKGLRLSVRIGEHDLEIRHQQAKKFLEHGDKVRPEIILRGREKAHPELANEVMATLIKALEKDFPIRIEQPIQKQAGKITSIIARA